MADQYPLEHPRPSNLRLAWQNHALATLVCVGVLILSLTLCSANNRAYPIAYHPDESTKVDQIVRDFRNFNHPQLMLETTELLVGFGETPASQLPREHVAHLGRTSSAIFAAVASVAAAGVGYAVAGLPGCLAAGLVVALCPALLAYAHYFKEDPALVVGIMLSVLASRWLWTARSWSVDILASAALGVGVAVAVSGKYAGAMALLIAVPTMLLGWGWRRGRDRAPATSAPSSFAASTGISPSLTPSPPAVGVAGLGGSLIVDVAPTRQQLRELRRRRLAWLRLLVRPLVFAVAGYFAIITINHRVFEQFDRFQRAFEREKEHALSEHFGLTLTQPNGYFVDALLMQTQPHVLVLAGAYVALIPLTWRHRRGWDLLLPLFAAGCLLAVSYTVIAFPRYVLPVVVLVHLMAGLAVAMAWQWVRDWQPRARFHTGAGAGQVVTRSWRRPALAVAGLGLVILVALQLPRCLNYLNQFTDDSRTRLAQWVQTLPPGTRIAADEYTALRSTPVTTPDGQQGWVYVERRMLVAEILRFERLRNSGYDYIAVADFSYDRLFNPHAIDAAGREGRLAQLRSFYERLFELEPVWTAGPGSPGSTAIPMHAVTNPRLAVYRVPR